MIHQSVQIVLGLDIILVQKVKVGYEWTDIEVLNWEIDRGLHFFPVVTDLPESLQGDH